MKTTTHSKLVMVCLLLALGLVTCEKGDTGPIGQQGEQGIEGQKGDKGDKGDRGEAGARGAKGDKGDKGDRGETGARGATGPKGDTGNANVLSSTYTFNRTAITQYNGTANIQIPSTHVLEPTGFDGAFMAYLTPLDVLFGNYSAGVTITLPHAWYNNTTATMATATAHRTSFGTYYFAVNYQGSTSNSFPFLNSGRFSLRLVWIPKAVVAFHPTLDLKNYNEVAKAFNL